MALTGTALQRAVRQSPEKALPLRSRTEGHATDPVLA